MTDPHVVAIVPARGGSKRIPGKNLMPLAGQPLLAHTLRHARQARSVSEVWVSTEDASIASLAQREGARVAPRPDALASDTAASEPALLHVLDHRLEHGLRDPEVVVFLQATSPVRRPDDIDRAVRQLVEQDADSLFSVCENTRFIWERVGGEWRSINYDYRHRQREQDMPLQVRENGSIYLFRPAVLRSSGNRLGGRISVYEMDYWTSFQIDTPEHAELCEWILSRPEFSRRGVDWPADIHLVIFDFDGVMTDNGVWISEDGDELARAHRGDGWGIARLREAGVPMFVLSTEERSIAAARCRKLKIPCHHNVSDKGTFVRAYLLEHGIDRSGVAYVGNDVNDLSAMEEVGFPVAVADAHPAVLKAARVVLSSRGGHGAVREFCDEVLARRRGEAPVEGRSGS